MKKIAWMLVGVIILTGGVVAWRSGVSRTNGFARDAPSRTEAVTEAPDFSLQSLNGTAIRLAAYRGKKPVILDFWASWCPNCQRDMPKLNALYEKYKDRVEVIGVDLQEDRETVSNFISSLGIAYPIVIDHGDVANLYAVRYTNTHVLITKDGAIFTIIPGDISEDAFQNLSR